MVRLSEGQWCKLAGYAVKPAAGTRVAIPSHAPCVPSVGVDSGGRTVTADIASGPDFVWPGSPQGQQMVAFAGCSPTVVTTLTFASDTVPATGVARPVGETAVVCACSAKLDRGEVWYVRESVGVPGRGRVKVYEECVHGSSFGSSHIVGGGSDVAGEEFGEVIR